MRVSTIDQGAPPRCLVVGEGGKAHRASAGQCHSGRGEAVAPDAPVAINGGPSQSTAFASFLASASTRAQSGHFTPDGSVCAADRTHFTEAVNRARGWRLRVLSKSVSRLYARTCGERRR